MNDENLPEDRKQNTKNRHALKRHRWFVVISIFVCVIVIYLIVFELPRYSSGLMCGTKLKGLGTAMIVYVNENSNNLPTADKWCDLLIRWTECMPKQFICPHSNTKEGECAYAFNSSLTGKKYSEVPPDTVILFETKPGWNQHGGPEILTTEHHGGKGCNVLYADSRVEFVRTEDIDKLKWEVNKVAKELKIGDKAPVISLLDQDGKQVKLSDFKGKKILVYFYPKADTPGCTKQSCSVRDSEKQLKKTGVVALGISPDAPDKQKKFDDKYKLGFTLLCDTKHKVAEAYGVWQEKSMYGKKYMGIVRSSFLIDEKGKLTGVWYKVKPDDTVPNALAALK